MTKASTKEHGQESARISNSAILDGCIVGSDSVVEGCMIGKNTEIGSNVEIIEVVVDFDTKIPSGYVQKGGCFPNN